MLGRVAHIGITVRDMEKSLAFYEQVLGMTRIGEAVTLIGEEVSQLTGLPTTELRAVYLRTGENVKGPPLELLHFIQPADSASKPYARLNNPGITEVAFWVDDIERVYRELSAKGVIFLSPPQLFELSGYKTKAVYFYDPDGSILELIETMRT